MRKKEIFSYITNTSRNKIIKRLYDAGKAAYSDLLDTSGLTATLDSTGNFNYHLNFLMKNDVVIKTGSVYKLTKTGKTIALFIIDINQKWKKLEKILNGEKMNLTSIAEQFEEESKVKMLKEISDFKGIDMIMDETNSIGIFLSSLKPERYKEYKEIFVEDLRIVKKKNEKNVTLALNCPEFKHYLSQKYFGLIQEFLITNFGDLYLYTNYSETSPFLLSTKELEKNEEKVVFIVAPMNLS